MEKITVKERHFEILRKRFGNHSSAAGALGITASYYRQVRRTRDMSGPLRRLIVYLVDETENQTKEDTCTK